MIKRAHIGSALMAAAIENGRKTMGGMRIAAIVCAMVLVAGCVKQTMTDRVIDGIDKGNPFTIAVSPVLLPGAIALDVLTWPLEALAERSTEDRHFEEWTQERHNRQMTQEAIQGAIDDANEAGLDRQMRIDRGEEVPNLYGHSYLCYYGYRTNC
jgi:hypothetical protein